MTFTSYGEPWPNITLMDSYAKVHLEVRAEASFNIKGAADRFNIDGYNGFYAPMKDIFQHS